MLGASRAPHHCSEEPSGSKIWPVPAWVTTATTSDTPVPGRNSQRIQHEPQLHPKHPSRSKKGLSAKGREQTYTEKEISYSNLWKPQQIAEKMSGYLHRIMKNIILVQLGGRTSQNGVIQRWARRVLCNYGYFKAQFFFLEIDVYTKKSWWGCTGSFCFLEKNCQNMLFLQDFLENLIIPSSKVVTFCYVQ